MREGKVKAKWLEYSEAVIPEAASDTQREVMYDTFHAGAVAVLAIMHDATIDIGGVALLLDLEQEMREYVDKFEKKRAIDTTLEIIKNAQKDTES